MCFVQSEVEALAVEEREDVVKEGIQIGELDVAAGGDDEDVWAELLVLLNQGELAFGGGGRRGFLSGREPDDDIG